MAKTLIDPLINDMMGAMPWGSEKTWGLGGMLLMEDPPGYHGRGKGTMGWGGLPNLLWVSREPIWRISLVLLIILYSSLIVRVAFAV